MIPPKQPVMRPHLQKTALGTPLAGAGRVLGFDAIEDGAGRFYPVSRPMVENLTAQGGNCFRHGIPRRPASVGFLHGNVSSVIIYHLADIRWGRGPANQACSPKVSYGRRWPAGTQYDYRLRRTLLSPEPTTVLASPRKQLRHGRHGADSVGRACERRRLPRPHRA